MITEFTPVSALIGGALIGLSAALLMLFTGRIAGISGILGGCFMRTVSDLDWRIAFILGMIAAPALGFIAGYGLPAVAMPGWPVVIMAGLLVGFGTRLGGGCTSGHGVCGMSRLSPRSVAATMIFMATAFLVVLVVRHGIGG
jgi:uncharacterized membrane protein YedE/YeeE